MSNQLLMNTAPEAAPHEVRDLTLGDGGYQFDKDHDPNASAEEEKEQVGTLYMVHPQDVTRCKRVAFLGRYVVVRLSLVVLLLSELYSSKCDHDGGEDDGGDSDTKCGDRSVWRNMLLYVVYMIIFFLAMPNAPIVLFNVCFQKDNQLTADGAEPQRPVSLWRALVWPAVETNIEIKFYLGGALHFTLPGCFTTVFGMLNANGHLAKWLMLTLVITLILASFVCYVASVRTTVGVVWAEPTDRELAFEVSKAMKDRGWTARTMCADGVMAEVPAVGRILRLTPMHYPLPLRQRVDIELESSSNNTSKDQHDVVLEETVVERVTQ